MEKENKTISVNITNRAHHAFASLGTESMIPKMDEIKEIASILWDRIDNIQVSPGNSDSGRMVSISKTKLEETVMWAVKAISRG
jgi:hypothetical protein